MKGFDKSNLARFLKDVEEKQRQKNEAVNVSFKSLHDSVQLLRGRIYGISSSLGIDTNELNGFQYAGLNDPLLDELNYINNEIQNQCLILAEIEDTLKKCNS